MTKEQQIEEIANILCECSLFLKIDDCFHRNPAKTLYDAGFRMQDEVLKEFTEKIKQAICDNTYPYFDKDGKPCIIWDTDGFDKIDELLKEYLHNTTKQN